MSTIFGDPSSSCIYITRCYFNTTEWVENGEMMDNLDAGLYTIMEFPYYLD
jgi:hypothetical protein